LELDESLNTYFNIFQDAPENQRAKDIESNIFGGEGGAKDDKFFL
jgi:hypothetical protein